MVTKEISYLFFFTGQIATANNKALLNCCHAGISRFHSEKPKNYNRDHILCLNSDGDSIISGGGRKSIRPPVVVVISQDDPKYQITIDGRRMTRQKSTTPTIGEIASASGFKYSPCEHIKIPNFGLNLLFTDADLQGGAPGTPISGVSDEFAQYERVPEEYRESQLNHARRR